MIYATFISVAEIAKTVISAIGCANINKKVCGCLGLLFRKESSKL